MKLYKLTDENGMTRDDTTWGEGVTEDVIHAYRNENLAYFLNPIHANFRNPILWEAEGDVVVEDWGKVGCFALRTIKRLDAPWWVGGSKEKIVRVAFAVLCAEAVLGIYEKYYPGCDAPRKAIKAAREYIKNQNYFIANVANAAIRAADAAKAAAEAAEAAAAAAAHTANADAQRNGVNTIDFGALTDEAVRMVVNTQAGV